MTPSTGLENISPQPLLLPLLLRNPEDAGPRLNEFKQPASG